jgi:ribosomal protein S13
LSEEQLDKIREEIKNLSKLEDLAEGAVVRLFEGDLRREVTNNIKRLQEINCYR